MNRRSLFWTLLGAFSSASLAASASSRPVPANERETLPDEIARALDAAKVEFSQRPQLHYNRQRQHSRPRRQGSHRRRR